MPLMVGLNDVIDRIERLHTGEVVNSPIPTPAHIAAPIEAASSTYRETRIRAFQMSARICNQVSLRAPPPIAMISPVAVGRGKRIRQHAGIDADGVGDLRRKLTAAICDGETAAP